jgi:large subunit ribosomal protein L9
VTALQIADALKAKGFDVDSKKVHMKEAHKQVGTYTATLDLHKEVKHEIQIKVVAE